ncbi:MAG: hypothetical protein AB7I30_15680, partial [Isosphaeraceae bacterium]
MAPGSGTPPAVAFNAASLQQLESEQDLLPPGSPRTIFVAARDSGTTGGSILCFRRSPRVFALMTLDFGGTWYLYSDASIAENNTTGSINSSALQAPFVAVATCAGADQKFGLRLNGANVSVSQAGACSVESGTQGFILGSRELDGYGWNGQIRSVLVYSRLLGTEES